MIKLAPHFGVVLITVQAVENLPNEFLPILFQYFGNRLRGNVPVVAHFEPEQMRPRKGDGLFLRIVH